MRRLSLWCLCAIGLAPAVVRAQRVADLAPGTLIRLPLRTGATVVGPLAQVRADTVFTSTTVRQPAVAIPFASIVETAFADGPAPGSVGRATLLGAGVGGVLAYVAGRGETDEFRLFSSTQFRFVVTALGAFIGSRVGLADASPKWVTATVASGGAGQPLEATRAGLGLRF